MLQTDPLTGLFNYRYLMLALDREMERSKRSGLTFGLIMIDLDYFKRINDTYGHQAGNAALQWVGNIWCSNLRRIDIACRYGGEEFAIILPGTYLLQAVQAAERLRSMLENSPLDLNGERVPLTASFGVEVFNTKDLVSPDELIYRADCFLQEAKQKGRNRVCYKGCKAPRSSRKTKEEGRFGTYAVNNNLGVALAGSEN
jgi:diguanylate cyclase (GGDEF)-like protein